MCDPLTIASAVATVGSTVAGMAAQRQVNNARDKVMRNEAARQETLDHEVDALNLASRDRYKGFEGEQTKKATSLGDYFTGQQAGTAAPPADVPGETMPTASNNIVTQEIAKQTGKAKAFSDQQGQALGNLRAFGDLLGGLSRDTARDAGYLNQTLGFKKGWAGNVLPYELDAASGAGNGMKMLGDVMGGLGSIGLSAGLQARPVEAAAGAAKTAAPLTLNAPNASLPTFARIGNLFNPFAGA